MISLTTGSTVALRCATVIESDTVARSFNLIYFMIDHNSLAYIMAKNSRKQEDWVVPMVQVRVLSRPQRNFDC